MEGGSLRGYCVLQIERLGSGWGLVVVAGDLCYKNTPNDV